MDAADPLDQFRTLWDGSEPGWRLCRVERVEWEVTLCFEESGPSNREIAAARELVDEFRDAPSVAVLQLLRGVERFRVDQPFGSIDARRFEERARDAGLNVSVEAVDRGGYLPIDADGNALIIEAEQVAEEVVRRMLEAGVAVDNVHVD